MLILDANVWIAFLNKNDSQHEKAINVFDTIIDRVLIPEYILVEVLNVLQLKASKDSINTFLDVLYNSDSVEILLSNKDFLYCSLDFFRNSNYPKLSFIDQSLLCLENSYQIITFDKALNSALQSRNY